MPATNPTVTADVINPAENDENILVKPESTEDTTVGNVAKGFNAFKQQLEAQLGDKANLRKARKANNAVKNENLMPVTPTPKAHVTFNIPEIQHDTTPYVQYEPQEAEKKGFPWRQAFVWTGITLLVLLALTAIVMGGLQLSGVGTFTALGVAAEQAGSVAFGAIVAGIALLTSGFGFYVFKFKHDDVNQELVQHVVQDSNLVAQEDEDNSHEHEKTPALNPALKALIGETAENTQSTQPLLDNSNGASDDIVNNETEANVDEEPANTTDVPVAPPLPENAQYNPKKFQAPRKGKDVQNLPEPPPPFVPPTRNQPTV